ncbi:hypothetical protein FQR65_LT10619 [Abscondita terminalis]|nr:hypothetical protein FQR65_LT10619 [Abscondita terminalis]
MEHTEKIEANSCAIKNLPVSVVNTNKKPNKEKKGISRRHVSTRNLNQENVPCELEPSTITHGNCNEKEALDALLLLSQQVVEKETATATTEKTFCEKGIQVDFKTSHDIGVQVNTSSLFTVSDFVHTDKQLSSLTGIHSFSFLTALIMVLSNVLKDSQLHRLSIKNRVFLTFMKLKLVSRRGIG